MKYLGRYEGLSGRERDYLVLLAFVLARHGHLERALGIVEGALALGDNVMDLRFSRMILNFLRADYETALHDLDMLESGAPFRDRLDHSEDTDRLRRYIRARCYCESGRRREGEAVAQSLMRGSV